MGLLGIFQGTLYAVVGGVATRMYQPERSTKDIDVLVAPADLNLVRSRLTAEGGLRTQSLSLSESSLGLAGEVWSVPDVGEVDLLWSEQSWLSDAVRSTIRDDQDLAIIGLPYLIAMKLDASRSIDQGDLSRMLGFADDRDLDAVRTVIGELLPTLSEDLDSYIVIGRLEIGSHRDFKRDGRAKGP